MEPYSNWLTVGQSVEELEVLCSSVTLQRYTPCTQNYLYRHMQVLTN